MKPTEGDGGGGGGGPRGAAAVTQHTRGRSPSERPLHVGHVYMQAPAWVTVAQGQSWLHRRGSMNATVPRHRSIMAPLLFSTSRNRFRPSFRLLLCGYGSAAGAGRGHLRNKKKSLPLMQRRRQEAEMQMASACASFSSTPRRPGCHNDPDNQESLLTAGQREPPGELPSGREWRKRRLSIF